MITVILIFVGIIINQNNKETEVEKAKILNESIERARKIYNESKSNIEIPDNALKVKYKNGFAKLLRTENYIWIADDELCFFPSIPPNTDTQSNIIKIILYKIPLSRIEYYATSGDIVHENKITGGGGGGSSVGGAVLGGVIAGGAGAVIGSRKKQTL